MVSVDMPFNLGNEAKLKVDLPEFGDRVPSRQFRKSRTFLNSKRESKKSKEHKEQESSGLEVSFGNKGSQKSGLGNLAQKSEPIKKEQPQTVTLDKVLGGTYQAIDINTLQDMSNDIFPSRPASRRGRSKQRNFDIMEADEEEENHESVKDLREKLNMSSVRQITEESNLMNKTNYGNFPGEAMKFRTTMMNAHKNDNKTDRTDTSRERADPTKTYQNKYPKQPKKNIANSQSPRLLNKEYPVPPSKQYVKTEENLGISPLKTFGNKFNRMPATTIYNGQSKNENSYLMNGTQFEDFPRSKQHKRGDKKSQESLNNDLFKTQSNMGGSGLDDLSVERTIMGFQISDKRAKENRFLNQKSIIDEKFKDEDKLLLEKYGARFGINPDELDFAKHPNLYHHRPRPSAYQEMNMTKRIATPFAEGTTKRYDTFYRTKRYQNGYN